MEQDPDVPLSFEEVPEEREVQGMSGIQPRTADPGADVFDLGAMVTSLESARAARWRGDG